MVAPISGVCPVLAVPFHDNGDVDLEGFAAVVTRVRDSGVAALSLFGLASEFHKLSDAEREALVAALLEHAGGPQTPAVVSVTDHATEVAVERARSYAHAGVDALTLLPPFFLSPGPQALAAHVKAVLSAVDLPVIVQYAPAQTGVTLAPEMWAEVQRTHPNLAQVKVEAQPSGPYITALQQASAGQVTALVGYAGVQLPDALRRGAAGVQPGCSFSEIYVELWRRWEADDQDGFADLHRKLLPYISYWMQDVELIVQAEKTILYRRGIIAADRCRRPGYRLDGEEHAMIDRFLDEFAELLG